MEQARIKTQLAFGLLLLPITNFAFILLMSKTLVCDGPRAAISTNGPRPILSVE